MYASDQPINKWTQTFWISYIFSTLFSLQFYVVLSFIVLLILIFIIDICVYFANCCWSWPRHAAIFDHFWANIANDHTNGIESVCNWLNWFWTLINEITKKNDLIFEPIIWFWCPLRVRVYRKYNIFNIWHPKR